MALDEKTLPELPLMTEEEFDEWCDEDTRAEFVDGRVVLMSPVAIEHHDLNNFLGDLLRAYLRYRPAGRLLGPEFQVRLRIGLRRVPDLLYVAPENRERIQRTMLDGGPDAAWEFISRDSAERDWRDKYLEYREAGVREYWVIDPYAMTVTLYRLSEDAQYERIKEVEGVISSEVVPGFWLRTEWLWQVPLPNPNDCLREMGITP
jgi:Uma2 family endonuclease